MSRVYVLGLCGVGYLFNLPRLPVVGETLQAEHVTIEPGGKGANQAVALARLGNQVEFVTALGRDTNGDACLNFLAHEHVGTQYCVRVDAPTALGVVATAATPSDASSSCRSGVSGSNGNLVIVYPGAVSALRAEHVLASALALDWADAVLLQLEAPLEANLTAAREATRRGKPVFLNPAPAPTYEKLADPRFRELLSLATLITPNAVEAQQLLGIPPVPDLPLSRAADLASALTTLGPRQVVITLGAQGAIACEGGRVCHVPAQPVRVVDTTGAGDCFTAALTSEILNGKPLLAAVEYAVRAAAISVSRAGVMASFPTATELVEQQTG